MSTVICIHGVWMPRTEMRCVRRRLEKQYGFDARLFRYPSVRGTLAQNVSLLEDYLRASDTMPVHLVGHSLGGVLALRTLALHPDLPVARVVCLGSPLTGLRAITGLARHRWGRALLGKSLTAGVSESPALDWAQDVTRRFEVGIIAGTTPVGIGRVLASLNGPNDGSVMVAETRLPGARDHLCLRATHTGMVLSKEVIRQTAAFLHEGKFAREADRS